MLRIEAVTVCVDHADFLLEAAKRNAKHFDRWVVATRERDEETREVCRKLNLETVLTDDFDREGPGTFSKAAGINRALGLLSADCFHLHLDSDVVVPDNFRQLLELAGLQKDCIYGADRVMVKSWEEWQKFKNSGFFHHDYYCRVNVPDFPLGTRWVSPQWGYVPIGFFQLFHCAATEWRGVRVRPYPTRHTTAARCDVQFALQWDRTKRVHLPEVVCIHLESEPSRLGANWSGRTTKRFGPSKPEDVAGKCPPS